MPEITVKFPSINNIQEDWDKFQKFVDDNSWFSLACPNGWGDALDNLDQFEKALEPWGLEITTPVNQPCENLFVLFKVTKNYSK